MKLCLTAIMKEIKSLEEKKRNILKTEGLNCKLSYISEEDKIENDYDYDECREAVEKIDEQILRLRSVLAKSNASVIVYGTNYTISEALTRLAQLSSKFDYLSDFSLSQISRHSTYNGLVEYTECKYSVEKVKSDLENLRKDISSLQMAIDRTNLVYETEI